MENNLYLVQGVRRNVSQSESLDILQSYPVRQRGPLSLSVPWNVSHAEMPSQPSDHPQPIICDDLLHKSIRIFEAGNLEHHAQCPATHAGNVGQGEASTSFSNQGPSESIAGSTALDFIWQSADNLQLANREAVRCQVSNINSRCSSTLQSMMSMRKSGNQTHE
eukprot:c26888_g1_i1 orf=1035-1526(+)